VLSFVVGLLVLAVAIAILATITDLLRQWYANYLRQKGDTPAYEDNADPEISKRPDVALVTSVHTLANVIYSYKKDQHRHERQRALREKIIIVVGIVAACFAGWSAWIFNGQLGEMQETRISTDRPWIKPPEIKVTQLTVEKDPTISAVRRPKESSLIPDC
jgi:hypothetical protein